MHSNQNYPLFVENIEGYRGLGTLGEDEETRELGLLSFYLFTCPAILYFALDSTNYGIDMGGNWS